MKPGSGSLAGPALLGSFFSSVTRVADLGVVQLLDAGDHEADLAGPQDVARLRLRREDAELLDAVADVGGHQADALALGERAVDHPHQHHDADVVVEPAVDDHRPRRAVGLAARRRHAVDHRLEDLVEAQAGLGRARNRVAGVDADHVFDLGARVVGVGLRQIHLVEHRHHLDAEVERGVAVGHRLRLHALAGVDHQQRAFAGRQRPADLVAEVDVARRVDQVEVVDLAVARGVLQRRRLRLDRDAALALEVHRVEHLLFHLAIGQAAAALNDPIGQACSCRGRCGQ